MLGRLRIDVILPIVSELQICQGSTNRRVVKVRVNLDCTINKHIAETLIKLLRLIIRVICTVSIALHHDTI